MKKRARKAPSPLESKPEPERPAGLETGATMVSPPSNIFGLDHCDPDRAVTLTNAYIALVTEDERARA